MSENRIAVHGRRNGKTAQAESTADKWIAEGKHVHQFFLNAESQCHNPPSGVPCAPVGRRPA